MEQKQIVLEKIQLVGITARTTLAKEMNPLTAQISPTIGKYFSGALFNNIPNRVTPGSTYCVYAEYESDENGEYTYFVGEAVSSFEGVDTNSFKTLTIPKQVYTKFEVGPGSMPKICISAWENIWRMTPADLKGKRTYVADFEIYDERASDPENSAFDLYVGIEQSNS